MIEEKSWKEFQDSGMLWFINMILHTFGWSIVFEVVGQNTIKVYPARVKFRGFDNESDAEGYIKVSEFMSKNHKELLKEAKD